MRPGYAFHKLRSANASTRPVPRKCYRTRRWATLSVPKRAGNGATRNRIGVADAPRYRGAMPNFVLLDTSRPDIAHLLVAMLQAREAVDRRSWSHPQESTGEEWWADVLADPRARTRKRRVDMAVKQTTYRLSDEQQATILVECSKCDWKAAYRRDELIASHGAEYPLPSLLSELAKPGCTRLSNQWDHCGVHYVVPIDRLK